MKKIISISILLALFSIALPSCNKKLKEELKELDKTVSELEAKNTDLQNQLATTNTNLTNTSNTTGNLEAALEPNNPISWTINATDNSVSPSVSLSKSYNAKYLVNSKSDYQYISYQGNDIWQLELYKTEDFDGTNYAYINIYINVATNSLHSLSSNRIYATHYSDYNGGRSFIADANTNNVGQTVTANSININTTTGEVDVTLNWSNATGPTFGGTENGTISWKGTCFIYN